MPATYVNGRVQAAGTGKRSPWVFNTELADRAVEFIETFCRHSKGKRFAGKLFILEPWQKDIIRTLFGWVHRKTGRRRYRRVFIYVPRKNGKSTLAAAIALLLTFADGEPGAEVYSAASDREQARAVFEEARRMVAAEPLLLERGKILKKAIVVPDTLSSYIVISADAKRQHGKNPHGVVFDELHAQDNRDLYDVLTTGFGARDQPLMVMMTTAGHDMDTICYEVLEYARGVASGEIDDPEFLPVLFEADPAKDDWKDEAVWKRVNPNYGVSCDPDELRAEFNRALRTPAYENTFKRLKLNMWTAQETRWLPVETWDLNAGPLRPLQGRRCYVGLDLSRKTDLTAAIALFPEDDGTYDVLAQLWMPEKRVADAEREDKKPYSDWVRSGLITTVPGAVIDQDHIIEHLLSWARLYEIVEVGYDPWNASQVAVKLAADGVKVEEVRQGFKSMSEPTKELEALLLQTRLRHGGHEVMRWMFGNIAIEQDPAGNIKPSKKLAKKRIDGIIALINALARATLSATKPSVYETRGIRTL